MIVGSEADPVRVAVAPGEGFDGVLRRLGVDLRPQDGTVADARAGRAVECRDLRAWSERSVRRVAAGNVAISTGAEAVLAQHDVLTRNVLLVVTTTVIVAHYAGVGGRAL